MSERSFSPDQLAVMMHSDDRPVVIDVRRPADFAAAPTVLPSARWGDPDHLDDWSKYLPRDKHVVVYCVKGGNVCQSAAASLSDQGFEVSYLEGGIRAWEESGRPTISKEKTWPRQ